MSGRPLVVLAGWLGSQPRHLRRYQALYEKLGIQSTITITSPRMVVESTFRQSITPPLRVPPQHRQWTMRTTSDDSENNSNNIKNVTLEHKSSIQTTHDLAWSVLRQVHESQTPYFFFHSFSNGGCFLWEEIRNILNASVLLPSSSSSSASSSPDSSYSPQHQNQHQHPEEDEFANVRVLRDKLVGVVFDSSPAELGDVHAGLAPLYRALEYCTWQERWPLLLQLHAKSWLQPSFVQDARHRAQAFYSGMRDDPWSVPQLYLYSEDDALTMFAPLDELVKHRQHRFGPELVSYIRWKSSPHCCHLLQHPNDYEQAVTEFVAKFRRNAGGDISPHQSKL